MIQKCNNISTKRHKLRYTIVSILDIVQIGASNILRIEILVRSILKVARLDV